MNAAIAGAAVAFVILSAALTVGAFWAGWRLHRWVSESSVALAPSVPSQPVVPNLHVVGGTAPRAPWVIYRDDTEAAP